MVGPLATPGPSYKMSSRSFLTFSEIQLTNKGTNELEQNVASFFGSSVDNNIYSAATVDSVAREKEAGNWPQNW